MGRYDTYVSLWDKVSRKKLSGVDGLDYVVVFMAGYFLYLAKFLRVE